MILMHVRLLFYILKDTYRSDFFVSDKSTTWLTTSYRQNVKLKSLENQILAWKFLSRKNYKFLSPNDVSFVSFTQKHKARCSLLIVTVDLERDFP